MATLKCLACGHDNNVGDESCSSCSSSLNLKLCSACEAINANSAERCHSCNAEFLVEPELAEPIALEVDLRPAPGAGQETLVYEFLPATWQFAAEPVRRRRRNAVVALAVLPLLVAGVAYLAYYFYPVSQATQDRRQPAPKVEAAQKSEPSATLQVAPSEPVRPQVAEPKQAQAPAPTVSGKIVPPRAAAAPTRNAPTAEPKRTTATVTHTRAATAEAQGRAPVAEAPTRTTAAAVSVAVTPAPAANAAILPVSEAPVAVSERKPIGVTHTKAVLTGTAATTTAPVAATQERTVPAEVRNDELAGCAPAVAALGLCKSR